VKLVSALLLALACLVRPHHARCPASRDLRTGIRRDGRFACWSVPVGDPDYDGTFGRPDRSVQRDDAIEGRIYCGRGEVPIVALDGRGAGCQNEQ
jgi:hypothetical protein